ncbi:MAG: hypothetical protein KA116_04735 [Proteobacteria bacterium]|nr:hypothetical protein [Pseudomonadota bacterium]
MLRIFILILPFVLSTCSSFSKKHKIEENSFSKSFSDLPATEQKIYLENPIDFLSWTLNKTKDAFISPLPNTLANEWPKILVYGDLRSDDVLMFPKTNSPRYRAFYRLENSFEATLIWDLFTLSVNSEFIANYLRLGEISTESCLKNYASALKNLSENKGVSSPAPDLNYSWTPLDTPNSEKIPELESPFAENLAKKFTQKWKVLSTSYNARDPKNRMTRILIDEKNDIWRFAPLSSLESCAKLGNAVAQYAPGGSKHCVKIPEQGFFLLEHFPSGTQQLSLMSLQSGEDLNKLQNDFCRYIAKGHAQALSQSEKRKVYYLLMKHPTWSSRFANDVHRHASEALDAYRLSLQKLPK